MDLLQLAGLLDGRLAAQHQAGGGLRRAYGGRVQCGGPDAACLAPDTLGELDKVFCLGADLGQSLPKERDIGHQLLGQRVQIKGQVQVDDAVGRADRLAGDA